MKCKRQAKFPLGAPSKMPGFSWGISALRCPIGSKLAQVNGTICKDCYALNGNYRYPSTLEAHEKRLNAWKSDRAQWVKDMAKAIKTQSAKIGENRFRWFDSGDLQSLEMLMDIAEVCRLTPGSRHWLPTKEYGIVKTYLANNVVPENLCIRLSSYKVDQAAPEHFGLPGSGVVSDAQASDCQAYRGETVNCLDCDKCWRKDIKAVYYPLH